MLQSLPIRLRNSLFRRRFDNKIFFLHIPKCGGTSIDNSIRNLYKRVDVRCDREISRHDSKISRKVAALLEGYDYEYGSTDDYSLMKFREKHLLYLMYTERIHYISGHITFNRRIYEEAHKIYDYITLLRAPVEKWLSYFYYFKYRDSDTLQIDTSLNSFMNTEIGRMPGYDYVKYLGGLRPDGEYTSKEAIDSAKSNIDKFKIVGILEDTAHFCEAFKNVYGRRLSIGYRNINPAKGLRSSKISNDVLDRIKEICKPNIDIYRFVVSKIERD